MKRLAIGCLVLLCVALICVTFACAAPSRIVRIACCERDGFFTMQPDGTTDGYVYAYGQALAQYTGWTIEYVKAASEDEALAMLENGEVELAGGIAQTTERSARYAFAELSAGTDSLCLMMRAEDTRCAYGDTASLNGMSVGFLTENASSLNAFYASRNLRLKTTPYANEKDALAALMSGEIDALLQHGAASQAGRRVVAEFDFTPFSYVVRRNDDAMLQELNKGMRSLNAYEADLPTLLSAKYFSGDAVQTAVFTADELEYIQNAGVIRAVYDPKWQPIEYRNEKGEYSGYVALYFQKISEITGLQFEFIAGETFVESTKLFDEGNALLYTALSSDYSWAEKRNVSITPIFLRTSVVSLFKEKPTEGQSVIALPKGYYTTQRAMQMIPNAKFVLMNTVDECVQAVQSGQASETLVNMYVAEAYMRRDRELNISDAYDLNENLCMGVSQQADPRLFSILVKAIASIPETDVRQIIARNAPKNEETFTAYLYDHALLVILVLVGVATIIFALLILSVRRRKNQKHVMKLLNQQTEMLNTLTSTMNTGLRVSACDERMTIRYINDSLCRLLGYTRDEFMAMCDGSTVDAIHPPDAGRALTECRRALDKGEEYRIEYRMRRKDGALIWVQDCGRKYFDRDGTVRINSAIMDVTALKRANEELLYRAEYDALTDVFNSETFFRETASLLKRYADRRFVLVRWNIVRFKIVNDMYGTDVGDMVLRSVAKHLREGMPEIATYGRLEGDHFVSCYPEDLFDPDEIVRLADRLFGDLQLQYRVMVNFGVFRIDDINLPVQQMCDRANMALQTIRNSYTQRYAFYREDLRQEILREQEIVNQMNEALQSGQFQLYLQPQFNHASGRMVGAEALVRWIHPEKGVISPVAFIPVFEKNGFITRLDRYVWESACRLIRRWLDAGLEPTPISVNISRMDLYDPQLCSFLCELVERYGISTALLRLEITESAYMENPGQLIQVVEELRNHDFFVEIDDFGSGYSSLNSLKDVPVDMLKLDLRFLTTQGEGGRGGLILNAVVRMSRWLGLRVIAEGVETRKQADYLKSIGCELVQGYYYSKPLPVHLFEEMMRRCAAEDETTLPDTIGRIDANDFWNPDAQMNLIFNNFVGGAGVFEYADGKLEALRVNDRFYEEIQLTREQFEPVRQHLLEHVAPEDQQRVSEMFNDAIRTGAQCETEARWQPYAERAPIWLKLRGRVIACGAQRYLLYASLENVTKQHASA